MKLEYHPLRLAGRLDLGRATADRLHLVHANARGSHLDVPAGMWSLWLPLRGELRLESTWCKWTLPRRHVLVTRDGLHGDTAGICLVLAGSQNAWRAAMQAAATPGWLPHQWPCPRHLLRDLVHLSRLLRDDVNLVACEATLRSLCTGLHEQQQDLQPLIDRCNGRTPQRRYLTLQRLLRVHQLIEHAGEFHPGLTQLADIASYSPWHLIRMYREVFGETPSEHVARVRLARAWTMVRDSALPVCEITERLGFESQSAFCRAFKNAYGLTTTQARHLPASVPLQINPRPSHARPRPRPARRPLIAQR